MQLRRGTRGVPYRAAEHVGGCGRCFAEEKVIKRGENLKKARAEQERLRQRLEAQSQPTAAH